MELMFSGLSLVLLLVGARVILTNHASTCTLTAPRLWNVTVVSVLFSWTCAIIGASGMILATTIVLIAPPQKSGKLPTSSNPVLAHKFKTYYGTL